MSAPDVSPNKKRKRSSAPKKAPPAEGEDLAKYLRTSTNASGTIKQGKRVKRSDKKLSAHLSGLSNLHRSSALSSLEHDQLLLPQSSGYIEAENDLERTWKVTQDEIRSSTGVGGASKGFSLHLNEFGPYCLDYSSNGRYLAVAGRKGHVAFFDWHAGRLHSELHLNETVRAVRYLHNEGFVAVAQKQYVYIYDKQGIELHQLRNHVEVNAMEFLRHHFLLATVGNAGFLKFQDTSTGKLVTELRTKLGSCDAMAANPHTGMINLGHQNGTVTVWSPNVPQPAIKLLAHLGPVRAVAVDAASMGNRLVTAGLDNQVKIWDMRTWKPIKTWRMHKPARTLSISQKGLLAVGWGNHTSIYRSADSDDLDPYINQSFPGLAVRDVHFCPYEDVLGVGHEGGISSLIIPGAGEPNYDNLEANPYETRTERREREVHTLLDKVQPDLISMDPAVVGALNETPATTAGAAAAGNEARTPFARLSRIQRFRLEGDQAADAAEDQGTTPEKEVKRARGRNSSLKRHLRRKRKNVIEPATVALKEKVAAQRAAAAAARKSSNATEKASEGALDRFGARR